MRQSERRKRVGKNTERERGKERGRERGVATKRGDGRDIRERESGQTSERGV